MAAAAAAAAPAPTPATTPAPAAAAASNGAAQPVAVGAAATTTFGNFKGISDAINNAQTSMDAATDVAEKKALRGDELPAPAAPAEGAYVGDLLRETLENDVRNLKFSLVFPLDPTLNSLRYQLHWRKGGESQSGAHALVPIWNECIPVYSVAEEGKPSVLLRYRIPARETRMVKNAAGIGQVTQARVWIPPSLMAHCVCEPGGSWLDAQGSKKESIMARIQGKPHSLYTANIAKTQNFITLDGYPHDERNVVSIPRGSGEKPHVMDRATYEAFLAVKTMERHAVASMIAGIDAVMTNASFGELITDAKKWLMTPEVKVKIMEKAEELRGDAAVMAQIVKMLVEYPEKLHAGETDVRLKEAARVLLGTERVFAEGERLGEQKGMNPAIRASMNKETNSIDPAMMSMFAKQRRYFPELGLTESDQMKAQKLRVKKQADEAAAKRAEQQKQQKQKKARAAAPAAAAAAGAGAGAAPSASTDVKGKAPPAAAAAAAASTGAGTDLLAGIAAKQRAAAAAAGAGASAAAPSAADDGRNDAKEHQRRIAGDFAMNLSMYSEFDQLAMKTKHIVKKPRVYMLTRTPEGKMGYQMITDSKQMQLLQNTKDALTAILIAPEWYTESPKFHFGAKLGLVATLRVPRRPRNPRRYAVDPLDTGSIPASTADQLVDQEYLKELWAQDGAAGDDAEDGEAADYSVDHNDDAFAQQGEAAGGSKRVLEDPEPRGGSAKHQRVDGQPNGRGRGGRGGRGRGGGGGRGRGGAAPAARRNGKPPAAAAAAGAGDWDDGDWE